MAGESREYLRAYARGQLNQPSRQEGETVEDYAARVGADPGPPAAPNQPTEPEQPAQNPPEEEGEPDDTPAPPSKRAGASGNPWAERLGAVRDRIAAAPTPGGAGVMLLILLLFVALIVPVAQGYTRAQLLWLTLLGRTSLPNSGTPDQGTAGSSAGGAGPSQQSVAASAGAAAQAQSAAGALLSGINPTTQLLVPLLMPGQQSQAFNMPATTPR